AITILGAVEGLEVIAPSLHTYVVPVSVAIIVALFAVQKRGTARLGGVFGPVMGVWFVTLGVLGGLEIARAPHVLVALNPEYAAVFIAGSPWRAFLAFGAVVLA